MIDFYKEIGYQFSRSGGKGGQHVNKVATRVTAYWDIAASVFFTPTEKKMIFENLKSKINQEGLLFMHCSDTRSQLENKGIATQRMLFLVNESIRKKKSRVATLPTKSAQLRRLESKKWNAQRKANRKKDW